MIELKKPSWKLLKRKRLYKSPFLSFYIDYLQVKPNKTIEHANIRYPDSVAIAALTKENELVLVEQYRYVLGKTVLELPCGGIEGNESLEKCAAREFLEETGYKAARLEKLFCINPSDGTSNQKIYLFKADAIDIANKPNPPDECLNVKKLSLERALSKLKNDKIRDATTIIAILHLAQNRNLKI